MKTGSTDCVGIRWVIGIGMCLLRFLLCIKGLNRRCEKVIATFWKYEMVCTISLKMTFPKDFFFSAALQEHIEYFLYNYATAAVETRSVLPSTLPVQHSDSNVAQEKPFSKLPTSPTRRTITGSVS